MAAHFFRVILTQLDKVSNSALDFQVSRSCTMQEFRRKSRKTYHDKESHAHSLADLDEFTLVGCDESVYDLELDKGIDIRLVQRRTKRVPSRTKSLGISASS